MGVTSTHIAQLAVTRLGQRKRFAFRMPYTGMIRGVRGLVKAETTSKLTSTLRYYGSGATGFSTATQVHGLSIERTGHDLPYAVRFTPTNTEKIYYAHPVKLGMGTILLNGEPGMMKQPTAIASVRAFWPDNGATTESYYLYESIAASDGTEVVITVIRNN